MAQVAEDAAYAKATGRPLKSFLLGLTAGAYIALGFVSFVTTQTGTEGMPWESPGSSVASPSPPASRWSC